ncbi:MAG: hypothetical protein V3T64_02325 [Myxococcota bacterium]
MAISGFQDFWIAGSRVFFKKDDIATVDQPIVDLGVLTEAATPAIEVTKAELQDTDGGRKQTVAEQVTEVTEEYTITTGNLNIDNLANLFSADPPEDFVQASAQQVDVSQDKAHLGFLLKLRGSDGEFIYNLTSIDAIKDSTLVTTFVEDTDWETVSLARGIIRIIAGGAITENDKVAATITPVALSGKRLAKPLSGAGAIKGTLILIYGREGNAEQTVREASATLSPAGATISVDEFSTVQFTVKITSDLSTPAQPAGRLLHFIGTVPALS